MPPLEGIQLIPVMDSIKQSKRTPVMMQSVRQKQHGLRPLICFIGTLRALDMTADGLIKHLISALDADILFCLSRTSGCDESLIGLLPREKIVKVLFYEDADLGYENICDMLSSKRMDVSPPYPWRKALKIDGNWLGGLSGISGSGMHLNYNLHKLSEMLLSPLILAKNYTHFIVTRTDFQWLAPHPPLHLLDDRHVWIPEGEDYQGYNDRHAVCSRKNIAIYLKFFETMINGEAFDFLDPYKSLNHEYQLKLHLIYQGIRVGRFKNVAYLTGVQDAQTNCATVKTKLVDGVVYPCKYPGEVDSATANSKAYYRHKNSRTMLIKPPTILSRIPIWKARLRGLAPWLARSALKFRK